MVAGRNDPRPATAPAFGARTLDGKEECTRREEQRRDTEEVAKAIEVVQGLPPWLVCHEVLALAEEALASPEIERLSKEGSPQVELWRRSYKLWQHSCSKYRPH